MRHIKSIKAAEKESGCVATFGLFDGVHAGHRAVIDRMNDYGMTRKVLISFESHDKAFLYNEEEKEYLLKKTCIDTMISMPLTIIEEMGTEGFVSEILCRTLRIQALVVGENCSDLLLLKEMGSRLGFAVQTVPTVCYKGEAVTSDLIIQNIRDGVSYDELKTLLGHGYVLRGTVIHGKGMGRKYGMPTANLFVSANKILPMHGVYGATVYIGRQKFRGMTNIGLRPSTDDSPIPTVETFILQFDRDIYGETLLLELFHYVRGVIKFENGLEGVRKQVEKDIDSIGFLDKKSQ